MSLTMTEPHNSTSIPEFDSREAEAEFWDTHDITDYLAELKPVEVRFAKKLSEAMTLQLDTQTAAEIRAIAKERGVGPATLMRTWILEQLRELKGEH